MKQKPAKDIVLDTNVIRLYDKPKDPVIAQLFAWLVSSGTLAVSQKLVNEYYGTGNRQVAALLLFLGREVRLQRISTSAISKFASDRHYQYTCNYKDRDHARLTFLSTRKKLVSFDGKLVKDVNGFRKVGGKQPAASKSPAADFYR